MHSSTIRYFSKSNNFIKYLFSLLFKNVCFKVCLNNCFRLIPQQILLKRNCIKKVLVIPSLKKLKIKQHRTFFTKSEKSFRGVLRKSCSENIQQIYSRISMPECNFHKVAKRLYWNDTLAWVFSCKFAACFHIFSYEHLWKAASASVTHNISQQLIRFKHFFPQLFLLLEEIIASFAIGVETANFQSIQ